MAVFTATQEEFLRLLDENAEFRQQVRQRILSRELIELPERFAVFASRVDEFITEQRTVNAELRAFNAEQRETNARVEKRLQGIADDIGMLKGNVAVRATRDNAERIV